MAGVIRELSREVIERMAAGEVVSSPTNLVKELLENSLDARGRNITVSVGRDVVDEISVEDDGEGIHEEDAELLCRRFTTSKLERIEDLEGIGTLGFRGEALSSASVCADLTVSSLRDRGWRGEYRKTALVHIAPQTMENRGTRIVVRKLFSEVREKEEHFWGRKEEVKSIQGLVMKYAIRYNTVGFTVRERRGLTETQTRAMDKAGVIGQIYGHGLARELLDVECAWAGGSVRGYITHTNYSLPRPIFTLFVNKRLVESRRIRSRVLSLYKDILQRAYPFVYLEVDVPGERVDVNVHPSKKEVYVVGEAEMVEQIVEAIQDRLKSSVISSTPLSDMKEGRREGRGREMYALECSEARDSRRPDKAKKREDLGEGQVKEAKEEGGSQHSLLKRMQQRVCPSKRIRSDGGEQRLEVFSTPEKKVQRSGGVSEEVERVRASLSSPVTDGIYFKDLVFVGAGDRDTVFVQKGLHLLLLNMKKVFRAHLRHEIVGNLGSFPTYKVEEAALRVKEEEAGVLSTFFNIRADEGGAVSVPQLLKLPVETRWKRFIEEEKAGLGVPGMVDRILDLFEDAYVGNEYLVFQEMHSKNFFFERSGAKEVVDVPSLYKYFERC